MSAMPGVDEPRRVGNGVVMQLRAPSQFSHVRIRHEEARLGDGFTSIAHGNYGY